PCMELVAVAAAEDDVLRLERGDEACDDVLDVTPPLRQPMSFQSVQSDVRLERFVPVRQVAQLHRLHDAVDDHGGAETGPEPQKEHLAAFVAAQRLHGGVVYELYRPSASGPIGESDPAPAQMARLQHPE